LLYYLNRNRAMIVDRLGMKKIEHDNPGTKNCVHDVPRVHGGIVA